MLPLVVLVTMAVSGPTRPATIQVDPVQKYADWESLDALADAVRKDYRLPGLSIAYQHLGDDAQISSSGLRNMKFVNGPIEDDDRLLVGSIGKSMTATLVARLVEVNKLSWQTPLSVALPAVKMDDAYKKITIEDLLRETARLPGPGRITQEELDKMAAQSTTPKDLRKAYVTKLLSIPPGDTQGMAPNGDIDYAVAGYAVERIANQEYEWLMQQYIFGPMKMSTAMIAPVGSQGQVGSRGCVAPHILGDFGFQPFNLPPSNLDYVMAPAGAGISCSIGDLLGYATYHLQGLMGKPKVLSAESYAWLHTPLKGEKAVFGWNLAATPSGEPFQVQAAANGSFCSDLAIYPQSKLAIVAVTNCGVARRPSPTMLTLLAIKAKLEQNK